MPQHHDHLETDDGSASLTRWASALGVPERVVAGELARFFTENLPGERDATAVEELRIRLQERARREAITP